MSGLFLKSLKREVQLLHASPQWVGHAVFFYLAIVVFFPLALPVNQAISHTVFPAVVWVALFFAFFLRSEHLYQDDYNDGVIEQWVASGCALHEIVTAKLLVHWAATLLPILVVTPVLAMMYGFKGHDAFMLIAAMLAGSGAIFCLCALVSAISVGMRQQGLFSAVIIFPLMIPVLVFGAGVVSTQSVSVNGILALLMACSLIAFAVFPSVVGLLLQEK